LKTVQFDKMLMPENHLYLDILVEITLQFIRAEYSKEKFSQYGGSDQQRENQESDT
jgi:hypothetical protein